MLLLSSWTLQDATCVRTWTPLNAPSTESSLSPAGHTLSTTWSSSSFNRNVPQQEFFLQLGTSKRNNTHKTVFTMCQYLETLYWTALKLYSQSSLTELRSLKIIWTEFRSEHTETNHQVLTYHNQWYPHNHYGQCFDILSFCWINGTRSNHHENNVGWDHTNNEDWKVQLRILPDHYTFFYIIRYSWCSPLNPVALWSDAWELHRFWCLWRLSTAVQQNRISVKVVIYYPW